MLNDATHSVVVGRNLNGDKNLHALNIAVEQYGEFADLTDACTLVHFYAQLAHESAGFRYDREIWGPTPAQKRYDTRTDLGNTAARDGDGKLYMGRTGIQVTGKHNYREFRDWCIHHGLDAPDFVAYPQRINDDPWEGLAPIWYWLTRNISRKARTSGIRSVTYAINGGYNGLADRKRLYLRYAQMVMWGQIMEPRGLQKALGVAEDGIIGNQTLDALNLRLQKED